jgi:hypothetical protein
MAAQANRYSFYRPAPKPKPKVAKVVAKPLPGGSLYGTYTPAAHAAFATAGSTPSQATTPSTPSTPAAPGIDYAAIIKGDPLYNAELTQQGEQRFNLNQDYGKDFSYTDPGTGVTRDVTVSNPGTADYNPNSVLARLGQLFQRNVQGINDTANAHGILYSGIHNQSVTNETQADADRQSAAALAHDRSLQSLSDASATSYANAYLRALASAGSYSQGQGQQGQGQQASTGSVAATQTTGATGPSAGPAAQNTPLPGGSMFGTYTPAAHAARPKAPSKPKVGKVVKPLPGASLHSFHTPGR